MDPALPQSLGNMNTKKPPATPQLLFEFDLANFEPVKLLGKGAFGKVVLVYDRAADTNFAVKLIPIGPDYSYMRQWDNIIRERLVMDMLTWHVCFSQYYFTSVTEQYAWFGMKYYPGGCLKSLIKKCSMGERKLSMEDAQLIIAEMLTAVNKVHRKGILHRDIKPSNFLIDSKGHIVLSDFGLSTAFDKRWPVAQHLCRDYLSKGNTFTAPEMTTRPTVYSYPVDAYSVGKTIGALCAEENRDESWSDRNVADVAKLVASLTKVLVLERASLASVVHYPFFTNILWQRAEAGKLDMSRFAPTEVVTQEPEPDCDLSMGSLEAPPAEMNDIVREFSIKQRYRQNFQIPRIEEESSEDEP